MKNESFFKKLFPWLMVLMGAVFYCYEYMLRLVPSVMIPELMSDFNIQATQIGLISASYYLGYVLSSGVVGFVIDRYLPRRVIIIAMVTCIVATYMFAQADNLWTARIARFILGVASAFGFVGVLKIGAMWLPENRFGAVAGLASFLGMVTAMLGQNYLSFQMNFLTWQELNVQAAVVGLAILAVFVFLLHDKKSQTKRVMEVKALLPCRDTFDFLKSKAFWYNGIIGCTTFLPIIAFADLWGIPYIQQAYDLSREQATFYNSMIYFGWAIGGPFFGMVFDSTQNWGKTVFLGTLGALVSVVWVLYIPNSLMLLPVLLFLFGFFGSSHVLVFISGKMLLPARAGAALALTNFMIMMGGMIVQPLIGTLLDELKRYHVGDTELYQIAMGVVPLALVWTLYLVVRLQNQLGQKADTPELVQGREQVAT